MRTCPQAGWGALALFWNAERAGMTRLKLRELNLYSFCVFYVGNLEVRERETGSLLKPLVLQITAAANGCGEHLQKAVGCLAVQARL